MSQFINQCIEIRAATEESALSSFVSGIELMQDAELLWHIIELLQINTESILKKWLNPIIHISVPGSAHGDDQIYFLNYDEKYKTFSKKSVYLLETNNNIAFELCNNVLKMQLLTDYYDTIEIRFSATRVRYLLHYCDNHRTDKSIGNENLKSCLGIYYDKFCDMKFAAKYLNDNIM